MGMVGVEGQEEENMNLSNPTLIRARLLQLPSLAPIIVHCHSLAECCRGPGREVPQAGISLLNPLPPGDRKYLPTQLVRSWEASTVLQDHVWRSCFR